MVAKIATLLFSIFLLASCLATETPTQKAVVTLTPVDEKVEAETTALPEPAPTDTAISQAGERATATIPPATPTEVPAVQEDEVTSESVANADVEFVRAIESADGIWTFHVTVRHPDTGWEDYADGWDVVTPDGTVLKVNEGDQFTRLLLHPHENEQPFTRSQSGIVIPESISQVTVRAHDLVDGYGGREVIVDLTVESGPDFKLERP